jgi:serine/threonine protein kinase
MPNNISFPDPTEVENAVNKIDLDISADIPKHGNCGQIYKAIGKDKKIYAIKVLRDSFPKDRILREVEPLKNINHPNIMKVYGYQEIGNIKMILEEYVDGTSLGEVVGSDQEYSELEILDIVQKINSALSLMWTKFLVHRDIKPDNIIIRKDTKEPVLVDFGLLKDLSRLTVITTVGFQPGTPAYQPIECLSGNCKADYRSDQFSLGVTIYELICKKHPFDYDLDNIKDPNFTPKSISLVRPDISEETILMIGKMMNRDLMDRYMNHDQINEEINKIKYRLENKTQEKFLKSNTFYLHVSSRYKQTKDFIENKGADGLIISANIKPKQIETISKLLSGDVKTLLIDPETYKTMPCKSHVKEKNRSYFENNFLKTDTGQEISNKDISYWSDNSKIKSFTKNTLDFQKNNLATQLITPYFYMDTTLDGWLEINEYMTIESIRYVQENNISNDLILGLFIDSAVLIRKQFIGDILRFATSYPINLIYLLVDYKLSGGHVIDKNIIKGLTDFILKLESCGKQVILGYSGFEGIMLSSLGLTCVASGGSSGGESIAFAPHGFNSSPGTTRSSRYFLPSILTSLKSPGELEAIHKIDTLWSQIKCDCEYCKKQKFNTDYQIKPDAKLSSLHTLNWKKIHLERIKNLTQEGKKNELITMLEQARATHTLATGSSKIQLLGKSDCKHLDVWIDYLNDLS